MQPIPGGDHCRRLCLVSRLYITGFATQLIESVFDLKGKTFGYLEGSAFGTRLNHLNRTWRVGLTPPVVVETPKDCVQALLAGRISGMVGSERTISQVRRAVERSLHVFPVPQGVLGSFEMHLAVNLKIAHPAPVRAYLSALRHTVEYTNARKSVAAFQAEIASRFNMDTHDVRNVLTNTIFSVGDLDPGAMLTLWEREVVDLR